MPEYTYEQFKQFELFTNFSDDLIESYWNRYHSYSYPTREGEYEGERKGNQRHGRGKCTYRDGNVYEGEWRLGLRDGPGTYYYANGDRFEGQIRPVFGPNGVLELYGMSAKNGPGIYYYADGTRFECEWKDGEIDGEFTWFFTNGDRFVGPVEGGTHTEDSYDWSPGSYRRRFLPFLEKPGIYYYANGDQIEFEDCRSWSGEGTLTRPNGDRFVGRWTRHDGLRVGAGRWYYADGNWFEGYYEDGKRCGEGTLRTTNGEILTGRYKKDGKPDQRTGKLTDCHGNRFRVGLDDYHGDWIEPLADRKIERYWSYPQHCFKSELVETD